MCPQIGVTVEGAAANLGKGFGLKSGGYLCVSGGRAQVRGRGNREARGGLWPVRC